MGERARDSGGRGLYLRKDKLFYEQKTLKHLRILIEGPRVSEVLCCRHANHFCLVENKSPRVIIYYPQKALTSSMSKIHLFYYL